LAAVPAEADDSDVAVTTPLTFVTRRLVPGEDGVPTPLAATPPPAGGTATETSPETTTRPTSAHRDVDTPEANDAALMGPDPGQDNGFAGLAVSTPGGRSVADPPRGMTTASAQNSTPMRRTLLRLRRFMAGLLCVTTDGRPSKKGATTGAVRNVPCRRVVRGGRQRSPGRLPARKREESLSAVVAAALPGGVGRQEGMDGGCVTRLPGDARHP
jgi:hypothetical protein